MDYRQRQNELIELAFIDDSDSYDIDENGIYTDGVKYYWLSASGCSCWDGDYDEEVFDSFEDLKSHLLNSDSRYRPTILGAQALIEQAEKYLSS